MKDGYTLKIAKKTEEWLLKVKQFETDGQALVDNIPAFTEYLSNYRFFTPIGLAIRRFLCEMYGKPCRDKNKGYVYVLMDGKEVFTGDHASETYDITKDDVNEYVDIFFDAAYRNNPDMLDYYKSQPVRQEVRRLIKSNTDCNRKKIFFIALSIHLDEDQVTKLLNETLSEATYNFRDAEEIIALFCNSHDEFNSYGKYIELCKKYEKIKENTTDIKSPTKVNYTLSAKKIFEEDIHTEEELLSFLETNIANFTGRSETTLKEWFQLYQAISERIIGKKFSGFNYEEESDTWSQKAETGIKKEVLANPEFFARNMLEYVIPRENYETTRKGQSVIASDFVSVSTGSGTKEKTTLMPKQVIENMPFSDRLWDIIRQKKTVERKDIIFLKFFLLACTVEDDGYEPTTDSIDFIKECNSILANCGMAGLYPGNRFENIVLLSLMTEDPYIRFSDLIYESFII